MTVTRNCRHCTNMVCGDANWCEYPDGTMHEIGQGLIRYLDSRGRFDEICWEVPVR